MAPPNAIQKGKIVVVFVAPGENGAPNTIVGEHEFLIDMSKGGGR
jgi:hypothetical protein